MRRTQQREEEGAHAEAAKKHEGLAAAELQTGSVGAKADVGVEHGIDDQSGGNADAGKGSVETHDGVVEQEHVDSEQAHGGGDRDLAHSVEEFENEGQPAWRGARGRGRRNAGCAHGQSVRTAVATAKLPVRAVRVEIVLLRWFGNMAASVSPSSSFTLPECSSKLVM